MMLQPDELIEIHKRTVWIHDAIAILEKRCLFALYWVFFNMVIALVIYGLLDEQTKFIFMAIIELLGLFPLAIVWINKRKIQVYKNEIRYLKKRTAEIETEYADKMNEWRGLLEREAGNE